MDISAYGTDTTVIKELIDAAIIYSMKKDWNKISIYELRWGWWFKSKAKKPRSLESVVLDSNLSESIMNDMKEFQATS
jgi:hypothetical protein